MIYTVTNLICKINECAVKFEGGLDMLMATKRNDEQLEKSISESMDESREKLDHHLSELNNWMIGNLQLAGALPGGLDPMEQATEIKAMMEKLIESLKRKVKKYRDVEEAERKRRELQMLWIECCENAVIAQLRKKSEFPKLK